jgi:pyruvate dehydrogenase E2 component (dihydrolipoamide acetyltransferase)
VLGSVLARQGEDVPVGQIIGWILAPGEALPHETQPATNAKAQFPPEDEISAPIPSPVAQRLAQEHGLDPRQIRPGGTGRITRAEVQEIIDQQRAAKNEEGLQPASPKARRLAVEMGRDLASLKGSGPGGAVLAADVLAGAQAGQDEVAPPSAEPAGLEMSTVWRLMAERVTQTWTAVPHFYLIREVYAARLQVWKERVQLQTGERVTVTDLLVRLLAAALQQHPRLNASFNEGKILQNGEIHIGIAVAVEEGLVVPVIHNADRLSVLEIARARRGLVESAQARKLRPEDLQDGTFTLSNLGMYGVDAFNAILNAPQAAILAVGRIADRVVAVEGRPAVQPTMFLSLSCDHRVVDGARAAQFLQTLVSFLEEPLSLLQ